MRKHLTFFKIYFYVLPPVLILLLIIQIYMTLPPKHIVIEAGPKGGFFSETAYFLKSRLKKYGITAKIINVPDTTNIVHRVNKLDNASDLGFIAQDLGSQKFKNISSLGSIILEPLLIFVKRNSKIVKISDLQGKKVAIGPVNSGVRKLGEEILSNYNVNKNNTKFLPISILKSAAMIKSNEIDAALFLLPIETKVIAELSKNVTLKVLHFDQSVAITKHYPFLTDVVIPHGGFSIKDDLPQTDIFLMAMPVSLIIKNNSNTSLQLIIAHLLKDRFREETLITAKNTLPKNYLKYIKMEKHVLNYYKDGVPLFLQKLPEELSMAILGSLPQLSIFILIYIILAGLLAFVRYYQTYLGFKTVLLEDHQR
jgi:hypothetical protein